MIVEYNWFVLTEGIFKIMNHFRDTLSCKTMNVVKVIKFGLGNH